ncbi:MAG TPA: OmpA family protein [Flavobacteriales bacterium]|nr:OmpA family protein [Flavobacteriales bacterium]
MKLAGVASFLVVAFTSTGQIRTEATKTPDHYVKNVLIGKGIEVGRIKHFGMVGGMGEFHADPKIIGVGSGIIMSTGNVDSLGGPNRNSGYTSAGSLPPGRNMAQVFKKGDKDLNKLCNGRTIDISVLEFDFVPTKNVVTFNYVFASEEYTEYVGSPFNDVFGFFLSGPGIKGKINLATLPETKTPITINSINHKRNSEFYRNNSSKRKWIKDLFKKKSVKVAEAELRQQIQFDGLTTVLKVKFDVIPFKKYHIKIAIGDATDAIYDSGVFIEAGSFMSYSDSTRKYYDKLVKIQKPLNTDSILGKVNNTIVQPDTTHEQYSLIDEKFEVTDVYFAHASYALSDSSKLKLDSLATYLNAHIKFKCTLYGFTDITGSARYNQTLSDNRALAVTEYLNAKGVDKKRIKHIGYSFKNPKSDNATETGRAKNRRVEIVIEDEENGQ